jgi:hypothetical protein
VVDVDLAEFAFTFDRDAIPSDGNVAFRARNEGAQSHEAVLIAIPEGSTLEEAVGAVAEEEAPPLAAKIFILPGEEVNMALEEPLAPGAYAFVCFLPDTDDPEFGAHVDKGMVAEFSVE